MSKRDDFTIFIQGWKKAAPNITVDQYKGLIRQGIHDYGLSQDEAERIIKKEVGLIIGKAVNHFQELGLTIDDLKNLSEDEIEKLVQAKYDLLYKQARISANPRNAEKQAALNAARDTLLDPQRRQEHIQLLERQKTSSNTEDGNSQKRSSTDVRAIFKFGKVAAILAILAFLLLLGLGLDNIIKNSKTQPHTTEFVDDSPKGSSGTAAISERSASSTQQETSSSTDDGNRQKRNSRDALTPEPPVSGMVLIPSGTFRMGSTTGDANERPVHTVTVDAFYMDTHEVTNAQYADFLNAMGRHADAGHTWLALGSRGAHIERLGGTYRPKAGYADHPVVRVSWYGAMAYAKWAGKRLPTEAEWEYAARGGESGLKYPWGNTIDSTRANYDRNVGETTRVGHYGANSYGLYDMVGNVYEWCLDAYNRDSYASYPARNPLSGAFSIHWLSDNYTEIKSRRVLRGGSWLSEAQYVRVANRFDYTPTSTSLFTGFRCARSASSTQQETPPSPDDENPQKWSSRDAQPSDPSVSGMVLIPSGTFRMGSTTGDANERPVHTVTVDAFYMDTHEVTNAQYADFLNAMGRHADAGHTWLALGSRGAHIERLGGTYRVKAGYADHPVVRVSWYGAMAYAKWAGKRLPTEAEWEYAARGGKSGLKYPWGNTIDSWHANYDRNIGKTTRVGHYGANSYGLYDMVGNVYEWCLDAYNRDSYASSPAHNPGTFSIQWLLDNYTEIKSDRVLRGGSWAGSAWLVRVANRGSFSPWITGAGLGFRCVRSVSLTRQETPPSPDDENSQKWSSRDVLTPAPPVSDMVLIPSGTFQMGSTTGDANERPVHTVTVDAFYMDTHEVTNAEYAAFLNAKGKHTDAGKTWLFIGSSGARIERLGGTYRPKTGYADHPVVYVSWYGAMAYAKWKGKRLPTEAEWEYAARGGLAGKLYPWGDTVDSSRANYDWNVGRTTAGGAYAANDYGLYDMVGNVSEWCLDAYDSAFYTSYPAHNPLSGASSIQWLLDNYTEIKSDRVLRGGSWASLAGLVRVANRSNFSPGVTSSVFGFRCVKPVSLTRQETPPSPDDENPQKWSSRDAQPFDTAVSGMVLIPSGTFRMGSTTGDADERPVHTVTLDAFYMDTYEVTNAEYADFLNAMGRHADAGHTWLNMDSGGVRIERLGGTYRVKAGYADHPVVHVSWYGAMAYAKWKGKRLPTEAEWEYAARGGKSGLKYPWGNTIDSTHANYGRNVGKTTRVGHYGANSYGLYDMVGNVYEWCLDAYNRDSYASSPAHNPGASSIHWLLDNYAKVESQRVLRGGSWLSEAQYVRVAYRNYYTPTSTSFFTGFRCARSASSTQQETSSNTDNRNYQKRSSRDAQPSDPSVSGMVLIPSGTFRMGSTTGDADESPIHTVTLDAFYMDTHEVTNAEYADFLNAMGRHADAGHTWLAIWKSGVRIEPLDRTYRVKAGYADHPVVHVSWYGAMAYAAWAGKRLPTEAEWEYAARGGKSGLKYPWGNTIDSTQARYARKTRSPTAVGRYAANGYGLYDMVGNVWEWCLDAYDKNFYTISPTSNPLSGASSIQWLLDNYAEIKSRRVLRGGSWENTAGNVRAAFRFYDTPTSTFPVTGFRCARSVSP